MNCTPPEYVNHDPYNPGQGSGPEGFKQRVGGYRSVLHDFDLRIESQIAEGDWVETHWSRACILVPRPDQAGRRKMLGWPVPDT